MTRLYSILVLMLILGSSYEGYRIFFNFKHVYREVLPNVSMLKTMYPVLVEKIDHQNFYRFVHSRPSAWISLQEISPKAVAAILISEDGSFFRHRGYDPEAMREALKHNLQEGVKNIRGASTITQQVVKNIFLTQEKTLSRKIRELLLSVELERKLSKNRILEIYLNIVEWGPGIYGIEQASQKYFHKSAADLSAKEGAILAFLLPSPNRYQYSFRNGTLSRFGTKRVQTILQQMWEHGDISDAEYTASTLKNNDSI